LKVVKIKSQITFHSGIMIFLLLQSYLEIIFLYVDVCEWLKESNNNNISLISSVNTTAPMGFNVAVAQQVWKRVVTYNQSL